MSPHEGASDLQLPATGLLTDPYELTMVRAALRSGAARTMVSS